MKKKKSKTDKIIEVTSKLYEALKNSENSSLTKQEIYTSLGDYSIFYSYIVTALALIKKIRKKAGRTGGIELNTGKAIQTELLEANIRILEKYFSDLGIDFTKTRIKADKKIESTLYEPLKDYLDESGVYNIVENRANLRAGKKWENVDLVAVKYTNLSYHVGVFPKITGIEVKNNFPSITDIQQTASYLRYCHSAYLTFFDSDYTGKNFEELMTRLRDEGVWDLVTTFDIGLIVAFHPQERSQNYKFQIIKEAPDNFVDPIIVEEGIDLLLGTDSKKLLGDVLQSQIVKLISQKHIAI